MKKQFFIFYVFISIVSNTALATTTGVAFVHGTGNSTDALNDYWQSGFVNSVRQGLENPDNYVVVNCDFSQYMWSEDAAGCLAEHLTSFIDNKNIDDLIIVSHSYGANVVRWIMSNPTWDPRYPKIVTSLRRVNAMAPSSAGTPLARAVIEGSVFEKTLGWILGFVNDAVRTQQPSWMAYYNATWLLGTRGRPSLPKDFYAVIGTDVENAVWDPDSYCGGYAVNLGLKFTQAWLSRCSDGFIDCSSQQAAGNVWFRDVEKTIGAEPLSHNQSRRQCFGLDVFLRETL